MQRTAFACLAFAGLALAADAPLQIPLWPNGAPGSEGRTAPEASEQPNKDHDYLKLTSVHNPSVTVFLPPAGQATGAAIIVAPGGAHQFLAIDIEGYNVAEYLNSIGVAAFVLKYRLAREKDSPYRLDAHTLADARRAIRLVRSRAAEWHVNPDRIGIMGFSAGGEVAALAATRFEPGQADAPDPIERVSSRPDYQILIYPGVRLETLTITKDDPPAFLLCAGDDVSAARNAADIYTALRAAGVSAELHLYSRGGHGFGIREHPAQPTPVATTWFLRLNDWLADRGMLRKP